MNTLIFYSSKNTPGKNDALGAFFPEALDFARVNDAFLYPVNCIGTSKAYRRGVVMDRINLQPTHTLETLVFVCHGWNSGVQFGLSFRNQIDLALALARCSTTELRVVLYCCSTADGPGEDSQDYPDDDLPGTPAPGTDGGFADQMRDLLCSFGVVNCHVVAHATAGHCCKNPFVVAFDGDGTTRGRDEDAYEGGKWIIDPKDALWPKWKKALKGDLRFRFPFMSNEEIVEELSRG